MSEPKIVDLELLRQVADDVLCIRVSVATAKSFHELYDAIAAEADQLLKETADLYLDPAVTIRDGDPNTDRERLISGYLGLQSHYADLVAAHVRLVEAYLEAKQFAEAVEAYIVFLELFGKRRFAEASAASLTSLLATAVQKLPKKNFDTEHHSKGLGEEWKNDSRLYHARKLLTGLRNMKL